MHAHRIPYLKKESPCIHLHTHPQAHLKVILLGFHKIQLLLAQSWENIPSLGAQQFLLYLPVPPPLNWFGLVKKGTQT